MKLFISVCQTALLLCLGCSKAVPPRAIDLHYPLPGAVFPKDITAPTFRWHDPSPAQRWQVAVVSTTDGGKLDLSGHTETTSWRPADEQWLQIKAQSQESPARIEVVGLAASGDVVSQGSVVIHTSQDEVGAPIFYRQVILPFSVARVQMQTISWHLGWVSGDPEPRTILANVNTCANCHSFSADGKTLAMDVDYGTDKGTYAITTVQKETEITPDDLITWRSFRQEDGHRTFGLLARLSPDGGRVIGTVKETSVSLDLPDPFCSQLFFPLTGILAVYDRSTNSFAALPGADDPNYVQTSPEWSPDGKRVAFARAPAYDLSDRMPAGESVVPPKLAQIFKDGTEKLRYNLYQVPFNDGKGGTPEPLGGAAHNGKSNYFPRYSPDDKWLVYTQAESFMFNRPDSALYIIPAQGGEPRRMSCNAPGRMNSYHSFSPNGKWLAYASKANGPYPQIWLTHIDEQGNDTPPVVLEHLTPANRAANLPEFVNLGKDDLATINLAPQIGRATQ